MSHEAKLQVSIDINSTGVDPMGQGLEDHYMLVYLPLLRPARVSSKQSPHSLLLTTSRTSDSLLMLLAKMTIQQDCVKR